MGIRENVLARTAEKLASARLNAEIARELVGLDKEFGASIPSRIGNIATSALCNVNVNRLERREELWTPENQHRALFESRGITFGEVEQ